MSINREPQSINREPYTDTDKPYSEVEDSREDVSMLSNSEEISVPSWR